MNTAFRFALLLIICLTFHNGTSHAGEPTKPETEQKVQDPVRLILPAIIYAVPGIETNVYFDNVCLVTNPANYVFDVHCARGHLQNERWTFTPEEKEVGDYKFTLNVIDQNNQIVSSQESRLRVVPQDAGKEKTTSILMIGDSLTHNSMYPKHVRELSQKFQGPALKLIGSHNPKKDPGVQHEGYGGWTAVRFATHFKETARTGNYRERGSPFLYADENGKPKLDFPRYCKEFNEGKAPDLVTIFLGPNDVYSATDETIEARTDTMINHLDILVKMIHDYSPQTKIGFMLPVPPAATQDAFSTTNGRQQTRWQYKRNQHRVVERLTSHFGDKEKQQIYLVPTHLNLDCAHNYPAKSVPWNAQNPEKTVRQNNAVHPAGSGYMQIGDSLFGWIKEVSK
ncbi:SGNH/GDSL hydrolase family protein [uncultured Gimesia sp.]|uniref:SGNH/GDSL hydrolase family protein n=1 Tax=uncultured Gimesia sp. TaxID=1678688 RepID=UPI0030D9D230|tara:strand:+ start:91018 stop:92208 length:1191 start_codon:yes stop_codon:yes gene_type:complete